MRCRAPAGRQSDRRALERRTTVDASRGIITCVTFFQEFAPVGPCTLGADSAPASTKILASTNARDVYKEGCCLCYGPG
jgi:hypothetical protein